MRNPDWTIFGNEGAPCPGCGEQGTQRLRRRLTRVPLRWLRSGGPLFSFAAVCEACGYRWPGAVAAFGAVATPRWQLPWHLVRAVVRAVHRQRTAEPVPWLYLASAGLGAGVGAGGGGALSRRRSRGGRSTAPIAGRGAAVGALTGLVTCWSVFAWTAVVRHGTGTAVADAVLGLVAAPQRNLDRHARRDEAQAAAAGFAPFGLDASWAGRRYLAGAGTSWSKGRERPRVTELALGHAEGGSGLPGEADVLVTTYAPKGTPGDDGHRWQLSAEELAEHLRWQVVSRGEDVAAVERLAVVVALDGTAVEGVSLRGDERWVVLVRTAQTHVEVRGAGEVPQNLRLDRVDDLNAYPSSMRAVVPLPR